MDHSHANPTPKAASALPSKTLRGGASICTLGLGGAPLGNHMRVVSESEAAATIRAGYNLGIRYFDTAPFYGHGLGEHRLGAVLRDYPSAERFVSTKVGRLLTPRAIGRGDAGQFKDTLAFDIRYDYSYDGVMRSFEDSLQRLGVERIDLLLVHNIDTENLVGEYETQFKTLVRSGFRALDELRRGGNVAAVGVGNNHWRICKQFAELADFDCFMVATASAYSLLQTDLLDDFLPFCAARGIDVVVGGVFNSGILATGSAGGGDFLYGPPPADILARVRRIEAVCKAYGVTLASAALQFPLAHPSVKSVVQGARTSQEIEANVRNLLAPIPIELWRDLKADGLLRADAPTPAQNGGHLNG